MAWETRNGRRYFDRGERVGNQVHKTYFGSGDVERQAAGRDAAEKAQRATDEAELVAFQTQLADADQLHVDVQHGVGLLTEATLVSRG